MTRRAAVVQPIRVGVSACLLGEAVRWDGGHKRNAWLTDTLGPHVEWVPVCPEVELTEAMARFARRRIAELDRLDLGGYVLKSRSPPSCGMERVPVHGRRTAPRRGTGAFARVLLAHFPLLPVEEEERLHDPRRRETFVAFLLAYARWRHALAAGMTAERLAAFHAANELVVRAHAPTAYGRLGVLIVSAKRRPLPSLVKDYGTAFMRALAVPATTARHARVLMRVVRRVSDRLDGPGERRLLRAVGDYRRGLVPLAAPLDLLRRHVRRLRIADLSQQAYLDPHPAEVMVRARV
jgi:uncharacterized protein YbgA (DUF1722 family)/uncharacterized protein YbbK (DUF523 family)